MAEKRRQFSDLFFRLVATPMTDDVYTLPDLLTPELVLGVIYHVFDDGIVCLLYTSPSPRD